MDFPPGIDIVDMSDQIVKERVNRRAAGGYSEVFRGETVQGAIVRCSVARHLSLLLDKAFR